MLLNESLLPAALKYLYYQTLTKTHFTDRTEICSVFDCFINKISG